MNSTSALRVASHATPPPPPPGTQAIPQTDRRDGRWMEVVSHIDPRYGGLSASVPALGRRLVEDAETATSLAAFCAPNEQYTPTGYTQGDLTFWPASRKPWLSSKLRHSFTAQMQRSNGVHIHGLWEQSTTIAAHTARSLRIPYIVSAHGMLEPWALAAKRFKKLVYSALIERRNVAEAACLHALTRAEAQQFIDFGARSPIAVIPNGVDIPAGRDAGPFLDRCPELAGKRIVLFLARLHPKKGLDLLLQSWTKLATSWPDAHLVVAGPDCEGTLARLQELVERHQLGSSVLFTGMLRDTLKWSAFAAAECFILPSYSEGLSVSVLEAMGMGVPVIVTQECNMPEVRDADAGWVISPTLEQVTCALAEMLSNLPAQNRQLGWNGAALVQSRYTWPVVARQTAQLYQWVLGGSKPRTIDILHP